MPLRICFVTAEMTPLAKAGGLADVSGALAKYLHAEGHDTRLFMPAYASISRSGLDIYPVDFLQNLWVQLGSHRFAFSVLTARLPGSDAFVYLIDCPAVFHRGSLYSTAGDEHLRFLVLTHAAFICCQYMGFAPQIMHFNDWHTAAGTLLRRATYGWDGLFADTRTVLTIHNIGYQGDIGAQAADEVLPGGPHGLLNAGGLDQGHINLLRLGVAYADLVTTVSPTYAREIQTAEYGMGLQDLLRARADSVIGILNGVDYDEWDPRRDRYLSHHYGANQLGVKAELKQEFLQRLRLSSGTRTALIGMVTRFATQKGFDLLLEALLPLLQSRDFILVALGSGERRYEDFFTSLQRRFPARVHFHRGYSDQMAHWIEAASDMFLMPSHYEPCGLNQMYSLRYGTVPIVRRTGGLADSVQHFDRATGQGTGVVFNDYDVPGVSWAVHTALDLYREKALWRRLVQNAMAQDFSWTQQVRYYVDAYEQLAAGAGQPTGTVPATT
ncbi:MAG TPA: glycogen synthase [Steroidobacteraceae bacterium]|nr:glycogen synthase [Steroidobacteraceae bacterium]